MMSSQDFVQSLIGEWVSSSYLIITQKLSDLPFMSNWFAQKMYIFIQIKIYVHFIWWCKKLLVYLYY